MPIGSIIPWHKNLTNTPNLPDGWAECSGQTLNDPDSAYNNQVMPNLNGNNQFLRGSASSGNTGGSTQHTHSFTQHLYSDYAPDASHETTGSTANQSSNIPPYMDIVWIIRVK